MSQAEIIVAILGELKKIQAAPPLAKAQPSVRFELPSWISAGEGKSLVINHEISKLIWHLADTLYDDRPKLTRAISRKDWAGIVQRVIGPLLGTTDLDDPFEQSAAIALSNLKDKLENTEWNYHKRTFLFGCSFLTNRDVNQFTIGPATVWRRESWLDHALESSTISTTSYRRLRSVWAGKSLKKRCPSADSANEDAVIDAVGSAPYICTVVTDGVFGEAAKEKAVMAARFTLLGAALMWASPTKAIAELNLVFDGLPYRQSYAFSQDRPEILCGSKWVHSLHGLSLFGDLWEPMVQKRTDWWKTLGEAIDYWLSADGLVRRPKLMNQFVQALIWFHEACREPMPMIATTKFMAALDALASGGKESGIKALILNRLSVAGEQPVRANGPSFSSAIHSLYSQGRSRPIHGSSDRVGHDWENQRNLAESLARITLILCLHWAADHPNGDDPKLMIKT